MNVKHLISISATRKRYVPTVLVHITVLVLMDILVMVVFVKVSFCYVGTGYCQYHIYNSINLQWSVVNL